MSRTRHRCMPPPPGAWALWHRSARLLLLGEAAGNALLRVPSTDVSSGGSRRYATPSRTCAPEEAVAGDDATCVPCALSTRPMLMWSATLPMLAPPSGERSTSSRWSTAEGTRSDHVELEQGHELRPGTLPESGDRRVFRAQASPSSRKRSSATSSVAAAGTSSPSSPVICTATWAPRPRASRTRCSRARHVLTADTSDAEPLLPFAERAHELLGFDGVVTSCDYYLPVAAGIAARPSLPGPAPSPWRTPQLGPERATRNPVSSIRNVGWLRRRTEARQLQRSSNQPPPRSTR